MQIRKVLSQPVALCSMCMLDPNRKLVFRCRAHRRNHLCQSCFQLYFGHRFYLLKNFQVAGASFFGAGLPLSLPLSWNLHFALPYPNHPLRRDAVPSPPIIAQLLFLPALAFSILRAALYGSQLSDTGPDTRWCEDGFDFWSRLRSSHFHLPSNLHDVSSYVCERLVEDPLRQLPVVLNYPLVVFRFCEYSFLLIFLLCAHSFFLLFMILDIYPSILLLCSSFFFCCLYVFTFNNPSH